MSSEEFVQMETAREGVRIGERLVDRQLHIHQTLLERADSLTRLTVAELGGITVISGYALAHNLLSFTSTILILLSVVTGVLTAFASLRVAVGTLRRRELGLGPALPSMQQSIENDETTSPEVMLSLMETYTHASIMNDAANEWAQNHLVLASYWLIGSVTLFLFAIIYVVAGAMP